MTIWALRYSIICNTNKTILLRISFKQVTRALILQICTHFAQYNEHSLFSYACSHAENLQAFKHLYATSSTPTQFNGCMRRIVPSFSKRWSQLHPQKHSVFFRKSHTLQSDGKSTALIKKFLPSLRDDLHPYVHRGFLF